MRASSRRCARGRASVLRLSWLRTRAQRRTPPIIALPSRRPSAGWPGCAAPTRWSAQLAESAQYPERLAPGAWKIIAVAVLGSFLAQLDATVVNVSLSTLATELHTGLSTIQWVTSGYL